MARLSETAKQVRWTIMDQVLRKGNAPTVAEISRKHSLSGEQVGWVFNELEAAVCIAVQRESHAGLNSFQEQPLEQGVPPLGEIFYARPFANFSNQHQIWVDGEQKWFGECAVECCGMSAMFPGREVVVRSVCRQTREPIELVGRDGVLRDYSPRTLRVHFGYPLRRMPDDVLGWCDYNSFYGSEEAVHEWRKKHPQIKGVTRGPVPISRMVAEIIGKGRLDYEYRFEVPLLRLACNMKRYGMTKPLPLLGLHVPDPFFMVTPHMLREAKRGGFLNFVRFKLR
jgi:hypothetical protein